MKYSAYVLILACEVIAYILFRYFTQDRIVAADVSFAAYVLVWAMTIFAVSSRELST